MPAARTIIITICMGLLALVPPITAWLDQSFYLELFAKILIFAIAAVSLDLILGYGGMVSFGHAAYLGIGAYAVGILNFYGIGNGWIHFATAIVASGLLALVIGAISLRTSGVYFIMLTLAFTQMLYFLAISLEEFGGDDGLPSDRSDFGGLIDLENDTTLYYFCFAILFLCIIFGNRLVRSRFGMVVRGARSNSERMIAVGFPIFRYRLTAFVISGMVCGIAGALYANLSTFADPSYMQWTQSGELMIMVIMGGMGTLFGAVIGSAAFILLEEFLPVAMNEVSAGMGEHWMIVMGPMLILIVLFARGGIFTALEKLSARISGGAAKPLGAGDGHD